MLFSSMIFLWVFLPVVLVLSFVLKGRAGNLLLLIASLIFYAWGEPVYVLLMLFSILVNWVSGLLLAGRKPGSSPGLAAITDGTDFESVQHTEPAVSARSSASTHLLGTMSRKPVLIVCTVINLGLLGYYKYYGLFSVTINRLAGSDLIPARAIALPIGISFFTFQALSYVIDVYRGEVEAQRNILNLALYISFFPQLIAGPIVRYRDINRQLAQRQVTVDSLAAGISRFITGLSKKVLLANVLAAACDRIYALPTGEISGIMALAASVMYSLQIYYDFSGYSDMAIGLGSMFGFTFRENFDYPYISRSISEFWRRWHISLGSWFREYLYIPLGGNRKGELRTLLNLGLVFLLTGLWHGAWYNFIFWGVYHGFFCIIERLWLSGILERHKRIGLIYSLVVVNTGWIFFRVESLRTALALIGRIVSFSPSKAEGYSLLEFVNPYTAFIFVLSIAGCGFLHSNGFLKDKLVSLKYSALHIVWLTVCFILCFASLAGNTYNPFIYFRF